ncbi:MAG: MobC family plasmid mobilization relaxosome protein [Firmicutes bacterium]|nr:MobC family plasmid mobilization relaxosome protein [Bacillota bacterium]
MRKRQIKKNIYLDNKENKILSSKASKKGISESALIRGLIVGYVPKGKIPEEINELIYEIRKIGVNINQIAVVANRTGNIEVKYLYKYKEELDKLIFEIKKNYLQYEKVEDFL